MQGIALCGESVIYQVPKVYWKKGLRKDSIVGMNKDNETGSYRAADIIRFDLLEIAELEDLNEMRRRLSSLAYTANVHLTEGTLRMLADVNRA